MHQIFFMKFKKKLFQNIHTHNDIYIVPNRLHVSLNTIFIYAHGFYFPNKYNIESDHALKRHHFEINLK